MKTDTERIRRMSKPNNRCCRNTSGVYYIVIGSDIDLVFSANIDYT